MSDHSRCVFALPSRRGISGLAFVSFVLCCFLHWSNNSVSKAQKERGEASDSGRRRLAPVIARNMPNNASRRRLSPGCLDFASRMLTTAVAKKDHSDRHGRRSKEREDLWFFNLPENITNDLQRCTTDMNTDRPWTGTAVLFTGHVRTLLFRNNNISQVFLKNVFEPLVGMKNDPYIFAVLEYTTGGYTFQKMSGSPMSAAVKTGHAVGRQDVERVLLSWTSNFTLVEWTSTLQNLLTRVRLTDSCSNGELSRVNFSNLAFQWMKVDMAIMLMEAHEAKRSKHFEFVLKYRPDIVVTTKVAILTGRKSIICGSGMAARDLIIVAHRVAATVLRNVWLTLLACPLPGIDDCNSPAYFWHQCRQSGLTFPECEHGWVLSAFRHGFLHEDCGFKASIVRPDGSWYT